MHLSLNPIGISVMFPIQNSRSQPLMDEKMSVREPAGVRKDIQVFSTPLNSVLTASTKNKQKAKNSNNKNPSCLFKVL